MVVIICCSRVWACHFKDCCNTMFITYKMKTICQLKKKTKEEEMDIQNSSRAWMMIDIIWAHFWCDPAHFSSVVVLWCGGGHDGSGEVEEKPLPKFSIDKHWDSHHMSCMCCITTCWVITARGLPKAVPLSILSVDTNNMFWCTQFGVRRSCSRGVLFFFQSLQLD